MLNIVRASKIGAALIAGAVMLGSAPTPSYADTGTIRLASAAPDLSSVSAAAPAS